QTTVAQGAGHPKHRDSVVDQLLARDDTAVNRGGAPICRWEKREYVLLNHTAGSAVSGGRQLGGYRLGDERGECGGGSPEHRARARSRRRGVGADRGGVCRPWGAVPRG